MNISVGQKITTRVSLAAYYSGYGGLPICRFDPGDVGTIIVADSPPVFGRQKWALVWFVKDGRDWRTAVPYSAISTRIYHRFAAPAA